MTAKISNSNSYSRYAYSAGYTKFHSAQNNTYHSAAANDTACLSADAENAVYHSNGFPSSPGSASGKTAVLKGNQPFQVPAHAERMKQYAAELAKLAPSVSFRAGTSFAKERSGKTLTVNPGLLVKMLHDPQQEKDTMEMIKGVEFITRWMDSIYKASGKTLVYRHSYIDSDGRYYACSYVKNERSLKMSAAMRKERQKNSQKLILKTKEKAAAQKKSLQKKSASAKRKNPCMPGRKNGNTAGTSVDIRL